MSWFMRGVQSAIFYYLSCAPCTTWAYERKQQQANRRAQAERQGQEAADDGIYRHPLPLNTNTYWHEEMKIGPGPPPRKGTKERTRTENARRLNTGGHASSAGGSSANTTLVVDELEAMEEKPDVEDEDWNKKRYQRPDEPLWGLENTPRLKDGTYSLGATSTKTSSGTYFIPRNPAVNDLHPPVVSTPPRRKEDMMWMLQPPPAAKVMEGKEKGDLSRTVSRRSLASQRSQRSQRRRRVERLSHTTMGFDHSESLGQRERGTSGASGQSFDRESRPSTASSSNVSGTPRRKRPPPIHIFEDASPNHRQTTRSKSARASAGRSQQGSAKSSRRTRPALTTIDSSSHNVHKAAGKYLHAHPPSPSPSLIALQELAPPNSLLNKRTVSSASSRGKSSAGNPATAATNVQLPTASRQEEQDLLAIPSVRSKFPGSKEFRFPGANTAASSHSSDDDDEGYEAGYYEEGTFTNSNIENKNSSSKKRSTRRKGQQQQQQPQQQQDLPDSWRGWTDDARYGFVHYLGSHRPECENGHELGPGRVHVIGGDGYDRDDEAGDEGDDDGDDESEDGRGDGNASSAGVGRRSLKRDLASRWSMDI